MITESEPQPLPDTAEAVKGPAVQHTPISLVVPNVGLQQNSCSPACLHEKRIIRRELQKWGKNVAYLVGFESVAQEFVGPRRWKRIASGLPCPPSSGDRRPEGTQDSAPQTEASVSGQVVSVTRDEPVDWDPEKDDCLNCTFRKSKLALLHPEVPDSSDAAKADSSPVMKQSNDRMCSCDGEESCNCCNPPSPASSHDHAVDPEPVISTSSHLLEQLSRPSNPVSQKGRLTVPNPNYHLLQQLQKKQMTFGSASASTIAAAPSCDQPLDLSFNSTRAQQLPVATFSSSADATVKGQIDQNSLLDVVSGSTEMVLAAAPKRSRETTWKRNYSEEELNNALADIVAGKLGTRRAAVIYGIPRSTLRNKVYKLGKGSPVGPGRLPGRRPKSIGSSVPAASPPSSLPKVLVQTKLQSDDSDHVLTENSVPLIAAKKEPSVMPKTRVGRKSGKSRIHEEGQIASSASLKQMLRENIFNKSQGDAIAPVIDRNNNSSGGSNFGVGVDPGTREFDPSQLLNSPSLMALFSLMMMNNNQFTAAPESSACIPENNYNLTSNLFNAHAAIGDQSNQNHQGLAMFSTLDPATVPVINPIICSYLFNYERLRLASIAASAATASLSASTSHVPSQSKSPAVSASSSLLSDSFLPSDHFVQDYVNRLRSLAAAESAANELLASASASNKLLESKNGHGDATADMDEESSMEEDGEETSENGYTKGSSTVNGAIGEYANVIEDHNRRVDPVILKIPSLKSKKGATRAADQVIRISDKGLEGSESQSLLERNLLSLSSNRSNSYASSVNSEESTGDQSVTSGRKGSRAGSAGKRGPKAGKSGEREGSGIKNRPKRGRYRNYDREALDKAVAAVQSGEMSVHRAGTFYGVPHSTLEYKVKQRHLLREKKRPATSTSATTTAASSNNSSASSPPDSGDMAHPIPDPEQPDEKKFRPDSPLQSLLVNDL